MLQKIELIIWMSKSQRGLTESRGSLEKVDPEIVLSSLETKFQEECLLGVRTVREVKAEDSTEIDLKEHLTNADPMEEEAAMAVVAMAAAMEVADHSTEAMVEVAMEIDNNPKIETILIKVILIRSLLSLLHQVQTVLILALQLTKQALIILAISKAKETEERYVIQIRVDHFISA